MQLPSPSEPKSVWYGISRPLTWSSQAGRRGGLSRLLLVIAVATSAASAVRAENWPGFRGPNTQGHSSETSLPLHWSASENIHWKVDFPGSGWSSPIVWDDRVFLTYAAGGGASCHVICLERATGKALWDVEVFQQVLRRKEDKNSYATPTPVTDGKRVYAVFCGGGVAAVDVAGRLLWTNQDVAFYSQHGLGASPVLVGQTLVVPFDGSDPDQKDVGWKKPWDRAVVLGLDVATGKPRWSGKRGSSRIAHVTPAVARRDGRDLVVSGAGDVIQGFDAASGERLWSVFSQGEGVVPSIVLGGELAYSCSGFEDPTIRAVRLDGRGDVTKTHLVWEQKKGVPSQASPIFVAPHLYTVTDSGVVTCLDAADGRLVWQQRMGGSFSASPVFADGRIYFLSEAGETTVIRPGDHYEELAKNALGEKCQASMAVSQGQFLIRGEHRLYCIGR